MRLAALLALCLFATASDAQQPAKGKADPKKTEPPESKFNMKMTVDDIRLGAHVMGEKVVKEDLKNRVVLDRKSVV